MRKVAKNSSSSSSRRHNLLFKKGAWNWSGGGGGRVDAAVAHCSIIISTLSFLPSFSFSLLFRVSP